MNEQEPLKKLGSTVQAFRLDRNLTVNEFSDRTGLEEWFIEALEAGNVDPTMEHLLMIVKGLDMPMSQFFADFN
jgi:transcriptional regulator with XRE-family HTH domain